MLFTGQKPTKSGVRVGFEICFRSSYTYYSCEFLSSLLAQFGYFFLQAMMNLAVRRNWLDCTLKLIYLCQMLLQGYTLNDPNLIMLPYVNRNNLISIRDDLAHLFKVNPSEMGVAFLKSFNRSELYKSALKVFERALGHKAATEIAKTLNDLPIVTLQTLVTSLDHEKSLTVQASERDSFVNVRGDTEGDYVFCLDLFMDGSSKMNVHSKKFNKQKEEFWFLILATNTGLIFRKFSFNRKNKKIEIPVHLEKGKLNFTVLVELQKIVSRVS